MPKIKPSEQAPAVEAFVELVKAVAAGNPHRVARARRDLFHLGWDCRVRRRGTSGPIVLPEPEPEPSLLGGL